MCPNHPTAKYRPLRTEKNGQRFVVNNVVICEECVPYTKERKLFDEWWARNFLNQGRQQ